MGLGNGPARPLRALGAVLGDLADLRYDAKWIGLPASHIGTPHARFRISSSPIALFRTPLASDSSRGKETLNHVRKRRGTIALSHQVADLATRTNPHPSREATVTLIEEFLDTGDVTLPPLLDGNASSDDRHRHPRS